MDFLTVLFFVLSLISSLLTGAVRRKARASR